MIHAHGNISRKEFKLDSILDSIKDSLNIQTEDTNFDSQIIMLINSAFAKVHQVLSGQESVFSISDKSALWTDFTTDDGLNFVKTYIYSKVKLVFDPPSTAAFLEALKQQITEYEYMLSIYVTINTPDPIVTTEEV